MSKCDEYGEQIVKTKGKISQLKEELRETILNGVLVGDPEKVRELNGQIKLLERQLDDLNRKYDRSLKRGGC